MPLNEFRAWLEGFEASFAGGTPTAAQWKVIKTKLATIAAPVPAAASNNLLRKAIWPHSEPIVRYRTGTAADYQAALLGYRALQAELDKTALSAALKAADKVDKV